ncbi:MAG TPA: 16S rRNA (cytosine(1402)-N(4))-methyltransferase RsmH [Alphaproteobacteria bacterium]|nr:16S rRNA (cytosine(1402)-N(4))-methyltransferase RsmH [Alphaproteobacteria bacterium]
MTTPDHTPVLLREVLDLLQPRSGAVYVDGTFGGGGYARALLAAADCFVWGIDRDPDAIARGERLVRDHDGRLTLIHGRFGDLAAMLAERAVSVVDGVTFDLGVSSPQIDDPARGFSFRADGPLDMRMERDGPSAADVVNEMDEPDLKGLIRAFGEERRAVAVAKAIVRARQTAPITRTGQLAEIVRGAVPPARDGIDPATRTFQALRVFVNNELGELDRGLVGAERVLSAGGRLVVVSFHSLEDRRVKQFMRERGDRAPAGSRHLPEPSTPTEPSFRVLTTRPIRPHDDEIARNPRARSARLRAAERTAAPAIGDMGEAA